MPRVMTDEHKQAIADGRVEHAGVSAYLNALALHQPKRGRKRTPESVQARLDKIEAEMDGGVSAIRRVSLIQERIDLREELEQSQLTSSPADFEDGFVQHAAAYGERKGIAYQAWREAGVSADVLKRAGVRR